MRIEEQQEFKYKLLLGDSRDILKKFNDNTFHMAVTSPPYWDQRDYGVDDQLGQEKTPEEYVDNLVAICREVYRTLREDGTFWLNIGDGYCKKTIKSSNLKHKDLIGVPWLLAFAMRKDGWYLRGDIIWEKENPMPESTRSRPSKSYEHLFLFSKSDKYFYDWLSIAEPQKEISIRRAFSKNNVEKRKDFQDDNYAISGASQDKTYEKMRQDIVDGKEMVCNKRDVWKLATASSGIQHFAIYPQKLIEPCIMAGTSLKGCCPKCKLSWRRKQEEIKEWEPSCNCGEKESESSLVLDPFNGSGTTGRACCKLYDRKYVGIDVSKEYLDMARESFEELSPLLNKEVDTIEEIVE